MGAWIEIRPIRNDSRYLPVAPRVGAWIEIILENMVDIGVNVAPRVGAWIEITRCTRAERCSMSLPVWERGLKWFFALTPEVSSVSLPVWERGLKYCVGILEYINVAVAPRVGAWIEMTMKNCLTPISASLPVWERGLKFQGVKFVSRYECVAPRVGAWIEMPGIRTSASVADVAPRVGAWIEMSWLAGGFWPSSSLPVWERGLK